MKRSGKELTQSAEKVFQTAARLHEVAYRLRIYYEARAMDVRAVGKEDVARHYDATAHQMGEFCGEIQPDMEKAHQLWQDLRGEEDA